MSLEESRKKIDSTDARIVKLIADRIKIAQHIGAEKIAQGRKINDATRERNVLEQVAALARDEEVDEGVMHKIYELIVAACRRTQAKDVAYQGEAGAYSETAALEFFGSTVTAVPYESLDEVFQAVEHDRVEFGIIPAENSLEGSISQSYDLLLESDLKVCGETRIRVSHCLIANPKTTLDMVERVYSHPQALAQCGVFLKHLGAELIPTYDTAGSAKMIKEKGITNGAAIASARAAEVYKMEVLASEIEDHPHNFTRFFVLAKEDSPPTGDDRTAVVFSVKHRPKALISVLKVFADKGLNLTKIESRPTRQKPWEYNFYLDFDGHRQDDAPRKALEELEKHSIFLKILGSFPRAK